MRELREVGDKVADWAVQELARGDELYNAGEYVEAITVWRTISTMRLLNCSSLATQKYRRSSRDPNVRAARAELAAGELMAEVEEILYEGERIDEACGEEACCDENGCPECGDTFVVSASQDQNAAYELPSASSESSKAEMFVAELRLLTMEGQAKVHALLTRLVERYPDTPAGSDAQTLLAAIESDADLVKAIETHEAEVVAKKEFEMAELFRLNGAFEKARVHYAAAIAAVPDSEWAQRASEMLESRLSDGK